MMREGIRVEKFASHDGRDVLQAHLVSDAGVEVDILNYGCLVRDWRVPVAGEGLRSVVLGFEEFEPYAKNTGPYFGAVIGRVANRIGGAQFNLDGRTFQLEANDGANHLHGGLKSLSHHIWDMETDDAANSVTLTLHSPDGDGGYPGAVDFRVIYRLVGTALSLEMSAVPDRDTPINLTQHNYFNLDGGGDVLSHQFTIDALMRTVMDEALTPTGEIVDVAGTEHDFTQGRMPLRADGSPMFGDGNFVLRAGRDTAKPAAHVVSGDGKIGFDIYTSKPGLQFFNSPGMDIQIDGLGGRRYGLHAGFCLEDQYFPDAVNHDNFPSIIYRPDHPYAYKTVIDIAAAGAG